VGGIEINSEILAQEFYKAGEIVKLITWTKEDGDKLFPFEVIRDPSVAELIRLHSWADIVFENNPSIRLSWPSILFKRKSVIALCTWISRADGSKSWQDKFKLLWLKRALAVIAVSEEMRKSTWPSAIVVGNPYRNLLFRILPDVHRKFEFVFLGRLVSDKGADMAINAFYKLINKQSQLQNSFLTIIGTGPERETLVQLITELNLHNNVRFEGALQGEELVKCLNQHRFMLVPSRWKEPFGNVALEGIACGCLPIVADGGGLPEAVGKAGLVFERGNIENLVSCMKKILYNMTLAETLRAEAKGHLLAHQPDTVANDYLQIIKKAIIKRTVNQA
jgi:glycosyltransferase involved in cell wall biosynthesis